MFTYASVLPAAPSEAALLTVAIRLADRERQMKDLAREADISPFAASRAATKLLEKGLLIQRHGGYILDRDHPAVPTLLPLAWRYSGAVLPRRPDGFFMDDDRWPDERATQYDFTYRGHLPEHLVLPTPLTEDRDAGPAATTPTLVEARALHAKTTGVMNELTQFWGTGQEVYSVWSNERLRDIVHQTGDFGAYLAEARREIEYAADWRAQSDDDPHHVTTAARPWLRATYLVSAEARQVARVITMLEHSARLGGRTNHLRAKALEAFARADNRRHEPTRDGAARPDYTDTYLQEAREAHTASEEIWAEKIDDRFSWHHVGGTPRPVDVGTAGDKILAVQMVRTHNHLVELINQMAPYAVATEHQDQLEPALATEPYQLTRPTNPELLRMD